LNLLQIFLLPTEQSAGSFFDINNKKNKKIDLFKKT